MIIRYSASSSLLHITLIFIIIFLCLSYTCLAQLAQQEAELPPGLASETSAIQQQQDQEQQRQLQLLRQKRAALIAKGSIVSARGEFPFQVALIDKSKSTQFCGGSTLLLMLRFFATFCFCSSHKSFHLKH